MYIYKHNVNPPPQKNHPIQVPPPHKSPLCPRWRKYLLCVPESCFGTFERKFGRNRSTTFLQYDTFGLDEFNSDQFWYSVEYIGFWRVLGSDIIWHAVSSFGLFLDGRFEFWRDSSFYIHIIQAIINTLINLENGHCYINIFLFCQKKRKKYTILMD